MELGYPHQFEPIPLYSFPGSGNTWVRHIIQQATGYFTGSVYHDRELIDNGFVGEATDPLLGNTIVVKSHLSSQYESKSLFNVTSKCIILIRNPVNAIISELNRVYSGSHTGYINLDEKVDNSTVLNFRRKILGHMALFKKTYEDRLDNCPERIFIFFENFQRDILYETDRIAKFLNAKHFRPSCVIKNPNGNWKRGFSTVTKQNIVKFLENEDIKKIRNTISQLNVTLHGILPEEYKFNNIK